MSRLANARTLALLIALAAPLVTTPPAGAATPAVTAQAQQANAAFLAYAPPPAGGAGALCLVDTGVNANPDTTPGLIGSYAIDNGAAGDVDPQGHGTSMAMIAGAAGIGMIGAWPQLKIVSVRATNAPTPGQEPTFEFNDYTDGMNFCFDAPATDNVKVVDLALSSQIPPSPDQAQAFATSVANLERQNVAVLAAAGNDPGPVGEPGAEPGVFAVGAATAQPGTLSDTGVGSFCSFTATEGVSFYAPGCGLDAANPFTDTPYCCADGTSQASAFTAAVLVALMSYDPTLTYNKAEQLLISTAIDGDLNVAAAFDADGLGGIVADGNANIPAQPTTPSQPATPTGSTGSTHTPPATSTPKASYPVSVRAVRWHHGILTILLAGMRPRDSARITLHYSRNRVRTLTSHKNRTRIRTRRPHSVTIHVTSGDRSLSARETVIV